MSETVVEINIEEAVREVLKHAAICDGLVRGIAQTVKALEAGVVKLVFLAEQLKPVEKDDKTKEYKKLLTALCKEKNVGVVSVPDSKELGKWSGLCKIDSEGNARKVIGTGCIGIVEFGDASAAQEALIKHIQAF